MLERADRDDGVERLRRLVVPPAAHPDLDVARCDRAQVLRLCVGERETHRVLDAVRADQMHEHGAPTAADVEHALRTGRARLHGVIVQLATLCLLKIVVGVFPHCARVAHRGIEPDLPELVADVVLVAHRFRAGTQVGVAHSGAVLVSPGRLRSLARPHSDNTRSSAPPTSICHPCTRLVYARGASWWLAW